MKVDRRIGMVLGLDPTLKGGNKIVTDGNTDESFASLVELDAFLSELNTSLESKLGSRLFTAGINKLLSHMAANSPQALNMKITTSVIDGGLVHDFDFTLTPKSAKE